MSVLVVPRPLANRDRSRATAAGAVALTGVLGLLTALSTPVHQRLETVLTWMPALAPATAGVSLMFISSALILMARGLRRGLRAAWLITIGLLVGSIIVDLVHGSPPLAAVPAVLAVSLLLSGADAFRVAQSTRRVRRTVITAAVGVVAAISAATGLAAMLDHGDLDGAIGNAATRLAGVSTVPLGYGGSLVSPALVAIGLCLMVTALWTLLSPQTLSRPTAAQRHAEEDRARLIVAKHGGDTLAYFALRDDKEWFFSGDSVVAYAVRAGVCVVSPDPIGPAREQAAVWAQFSAFADDHGWSVAVLAAGGSWLPTYEASGLRPVYLGDEAIIDCPTFTLEGRQMRTVRQAHSRAHRAGYTTAVHRVADLRPDLRDRLVELASMSRHGAVERGFSMTLSRLCDARDAGLVVTVAYDSTGAAQAFMQWVPCEGGWSLDVMRRNTAAGLVNGLSDFLVIESLLAFADGGATRVGLNFAVFRNIISGEYSTRTGRAARRLLRATASHTQIESLWRFNAKFCPTWVPRYAVMGSIDAMAVQGVVMAGAEGISELPVLGRFMTGMAPR